MKKITVCDASRHDVYQLCATPNHSCANQYDLGGGAMSVTNSNDGDDAQDSLNANGYVNGLAKFPCQVFPKKGVYIRVIKQRKVFASR